MILITCQVILQVFKHVLSPRQTALNQYRLHPSLAGRPSPHPHYGEVSEPTSQQAGRQGAQFYIPFLRGKRNALYGFYPQGIILHGELSPPTTMVCFVLFDVVLHHSNI